MSAEAATISTSLVYSILEYTNDNFGSSVDELIALEGESGSDSSTSGLEQRKGRSKAARAIGDQHRYHCDGGHSDSLY